MADHSHDPTLIPPTITFLAPPQKPGDIGRLAQYRILKQLGRGGMGVVYQALDTNLNRVAALKVMHPEYAASEEARVRFKREAQAAAALKHDHIVTIYQVDEEQQIPFLAMEFLAGKSLEEWLRPDRKATVAETLLIGKQIAKGLAAAHNAGLIHRDIKPANLWLEAPRGRVKILDFGLARHSTPDKSDLTQYGSVVGTPAYMAPEQARGEAVDHRCDLFSLGCVLFRMLAGRLPFQGDSAYAVLSAIATETPPPLCDLRPDVPRQLSDLIARLLAKKAQDRPKSAQAVFDELLAFEKDSKQPPAPPSLLVPARSPWWSQRQAIAATGIALLIVLGSLIAWLMSGKREVAVDPKENEIERPVTRQVDLIALVEPVRSEETGNWTKPTAGQLEAEAIDKGFKRVVPWTPPEEYQLRMKVTRQIVGPGQLRIGLSQGKHRFAIILDHKHGEKFRSGLAYIDGRFIEQRREKAVGKAMTKKEPVVVVITVRKEHVTMTLDGATIVDWQDDLNRLSRESLMSNEPLLITGNRESHFLFDELTLEPLGEDAGHAYPERAKSIDLMKKIDLTRDRRGGGDSVPEPGKLVGHASKAGQPFELVLPWEPPREYELRLKVTRLPKWPTGNLVVGLSQGDARFAMVFDARTAEGKPFYCGLGFIDGKVLIDREDAPPRRVLLPDKPVDLIIAVRDQQITVKANGTQIYTWTGNLHRSTRNVYKSNRPLTLAIQDAGFLFEEITLQPLSDDWGKEFSLGAQKK